MTTACPLYDQANAMAAADAKYKDVREQLREATKARVP